MEQIARQKIAQSTVLKKAGINESDVVKIWDALSLYLRYEMRKKKVIVITFFLTF